MTNSQIARAAIFLATGISLSLSVYFWFCGLDSQAIFIGLWVPSILSFGIFMLRK